jgi:hypothetical protein
MINEIQQDGTIVPSDSRVSDIKDVTLSISNVNADTDSPTYLEKVNSEISVHTMQEATDLASIDSSNEFSNDPQKVENSNQDALVLEKSKEESTRQEEKQNNEDTLTITKESTESLKKSLVEPEMEKESNKENLEINENKSEDSNSIAKQKEEDSLPKEIIIESNKSEDKKDEDKKDKDNCNEISSELPKEMVEQSDEIKDNTSESVASVEINNTIKDVEEISEDKEETISKSNEEIDIPTVNNISEIKSENVSPNEDEENKIETSKEALIEQVISSPNEKELEENQSINKEEQIMNANNSDTLIMNSKNIIDFSSNEIANENADVVIKNTMTINDEYVVDKKEDKSAVINGNDDKIIIERDIKEPSIISTSISDNEEEAISTTLVTTAKTNDDVDVDCSDVCNNSDVIESSVDNMMKVPNAKEQIPTISTVYDATTKTLTDGIVPQNVDTDAIINDSSLINNGAFDHAMTTDMNRRRSSLPNVSMENLNRADNDSDRDSISQINNSSPQKRPRSASTSTQVESNNFGNN